MHVEIASAAVALAHLDQLKALLITNVNDGASIGWLPPMRETTAEAWWLDRIAEVEAGKRALLLAWEDGVIVGSGQLDLHQRENGSHRAEVQKLIVHLDYRRRGVGAALMHALEACAMEAKRSLLFLDTREGDVSELLYRKVGYHKVGVLPNYVREADGGFSATVFYYKILDV